MLLLVTLRTRIDAWWARVHWVTGQQRVQGRGAGGRVCGKLPGGTHGRHPRVVKGSFVATR